jgi:hypothetical protein
MISTSETPQGDGLKRLHNGSVQTALFKRILVKAHVERTDNAAIEDESLLDELAKLGFTTPTLSTLRLMPLVLVAWADDRVDSQERELIVEAARRAGVHQNTDAFVILDHWLRHRPPAAMAELWKRYTCSVLQGFDDGPRRRLVNNLRSQMLAVANASGGWLGMRRISWQERAVIDAMSVRAEACVRGD